MCSTPLLLWHHSTHISPHKAPPARFPAGGTRGSDGSVQGIRSHSAAGLGAAGGSQAAVDRALQGACLFYLGVKCVGRQRQGRVRWGRVQQVRAGQGRVLLGIEQAGHSGRWHKCVLQTKGSGWG